MSSSGVRVLSWNADGLRCKIQELFDLLDSVPVDVIAISETRLNPNIPLFTSGFSCYRQDEHPCGRGQGVAILVKNTIQHYCMQIPKTKNIEAVGIALKVSGVEHVIIISIYQSPNLPLLCSDLDVLFGHLPHTLITGDFNANHNYWFSSYINTRGRTLFRHMLHNDFVIHAPDKPTQVNYCSRHKATSPDLVLCQNITSVSDIRVLISLSSNHYPMYFSVGGSLSFNERKHHYCYNKANWNRYRSILDDNIALTSSTFKSIEEIDSAVDHLQNSIIKARNITVPTREASGPSRCRLPRHIKRLIHYKNYLRRIDSGLPSSVIKRQIHYTIKTL